MWVPVAVRRVANCYTPFTLLTLLTYCRLREQNVFSHWCTAERRSRESVRRTSRNPAHLQSFCRWASAELWTSSLQLNVYTFHCIAISITFICFTIYGFYIFYNFRNYLIIIIIVKMQWFGWGRRKRIRRWTPTAQRCRRTVVGPLSWQYLRRSTASLSDWSFTARCARDGLSKATNHVIAVNTRSI